MNSTALRASAGIRVLTLAFGLSFVFPALCTAVDLSGCWSGTWQSCVTPHRGALHARFIRIDESSYEVHFNGRFFKILPFKYSIVMNAAEENGMVYLSGSKYLGRMFGTFTFDATASDCQFNADYSSCKDHGTFTMCRCTNEDSCYAK
jgi:hypothetical protein